MKRSIPIVLVLSAIASAAIAAPRGAGSKISGVYTFDVPTAARTQVYRPTGPAPATVATTPMPGERSFSYEPSTRVRADASTGACQSGVAVTQPRGDQATRSFSYEPGAGAGTYSAVPRRSSANAAIRSADSKIKGQY